MHSLELKDPLNSTLKEEVLPFSKLRLKKKIFYVIEIFAKSIPSIFAFVSGLLANIISFHFLSRSDNDDISSGFGLGAMFASLCANSWIFSFNQATNIFVSQSFGAQNFPACGRYFRRNLLLFAIMLIPLIALLIFGEDIMLLCQVNEVSAAYAGIFIRRSILFIVGLALFDSMKAFSIGQKIFTPIIYIQGTTLFLHILWAFVFIGWLNLGVEGAVLCRTLAEWTNAALMYGYIKLSGKYEETWKSWEREDFDLKAIWNQFKFAFPIAISTYAKFLYYEILTLISGTFDVIQTVIHVAIANTSSVQFSIALGISVTMVSFIGNNLGAKNLTNAKNYMYGGYTLLVCLSLLCFVLLSCFENLWASFWSKDLLTQERLLYSLKAFLFGSMLFDPINTGLFTVLKTIGKAGHTFWTVFFGLYVVCLPLIALFAFIWNLKVFGVWIAFGIGNFTIFSINLIIFCRIDWNEVLKHVDNNVKDEELKKSIEKVDTNGEEELKEINRKSRHKW